MSTVIGTYNEASSPTCNKFTLTLQGTDDLLRDMLAIQETYGWSTAVMKSVNDLTDGFRAEVVQKLAADSDITATLYNGTCFATATATNSAKGAWCHIW